MSSLYHYQSLDPLCVPTDAVCLLSWQPSPALIELHALCVSQCPLRVPSPASHAMMPLTVHYLMWGADELQRLGMQMFHSFLTYIVQGSHYFDNVHFKNFDCIFALTSSLLPYCIN